MSKKLPLTIAQWEETCKKTAQELGVKPERLIELLKAHGGFDFDFHTKVLRTVQHLMNTGKNNNERLAVQHFREAIIREIT